MAGEVLATDLYVIVGPDGRAIYGTIATSPDRAWKETGVDRRISLDYVKGTLMRDGYRCVPVEIVRRGEGT